MYIGVARVISISRRSAAAFTPLNMRPGLVLRELGIATLICIAWPMSRLMRNAVGPFVFCRRNMRWRPTVARCYVCISLNDRSCVSITMSVARARVASARRRILLTSRMDRKCARVGWGNRPCMASLPRR